MNAISEEIGVYTNVIVNAGNLCLWADIMNENTKAV
jgi:hypothetical protein